MRIGRLLVTGFLLLCMTAACGSDSDENATAGSGIPSTTSTTARKSLPARAVGAGYERACRTDTDTLRTAEEAFFARSDEGAYAREAELVEAGLLSEESKLHDVVVASDGDSYEVVVADKRCGAVGHAVGQETGDI